MTSPTGPRTSSLYHAATPGAKIARSARVAFDPPLAGAILACAMGTFLLVGSLVPRELSIVVGQAALVSVPIIAAIAWAGLGGHGSFTRLLGLRRPRLIWLLVALLIGSSAWYLNLRIVHLLPVQPSPALQEIVVQPPLLVTLVLLAIIPPVCEEILFRGVFARGLARGMPAILAIVVSAAVFSFYHLSLAQAVPTFTLGLAVGWLALRADSIVPAILVHICNNAIAVVISRDEVPGVTAWFDHNPTLALIAMSLTAVAGLALLGLVKPQELAP